MFHWLPSTAFTQRLFSSLYCPTSKPQLAWDRTRRGHKLAKGTSHTMWYHADQWNWEEVTWGAAAASGQAEHHSVVSNCIMHHLLFIFFYHYYYFHLLFLFHYTVCLSPQVFTLFSSSSPDPTGRRSERRAADAYLPVEVNHDKGEYTN